VADRAIINASPLIFFSRSNHLQLLRAFADELWVPEPVANEVQRRGMRDVSARAIHDTEWLTVHPAATIPATIAAWRLGAGEESVLSLAAEHPGTEAIIDDLAGSRCADSLNIPVRGTLGIVLVAKGRGLIPKARPVIEEMMIAGLHLSRRVMDEALRRVDE
jgi:predicted nucleic acid-binding protein